MPCRFLRKREHTLDRLDSFGCHVSIDLYLGEFVAEAVVYLLQGVEAHIVALVAATGGAAFGGIGRSGDELLVGAALLHLVQDARLGDYDELLFVALLCIGEQGCGRAYDIGQLEDDALALGMGKHGCFGILLLERNESLYGELAMHVAAYCGP